MAYSLGVIDGSSVTGVRELTDDDYQQYKVHRNKLIDFQKDQELYTMIQLNCEDIFHAMDRYLGEYTQESGMNSVRIERIMLDINRHLLNYLASFRTYLDHTETLLKKKFGKEAQQFKLFKTACSTEYDNCFAYRFLYKLRNYSQHCGMPAGNISISNRLNEGNGGSISELSVQFNRDSLLRNYDSWGKPVKQELEQLPSHFEVNEYINQLQESIERIHLVLIEIRIPELIEGARYIKEMTELLIENTVLNQMLG